uniref:Uncharacterized protein n=1 Tax=viral metagenome TaxID=1070528 RepID=A0A6C0KGJ7_9ZZZZ
MESRNSNNEIKEDENLMPGRSNVNELRNRGSASSKTTTSAVKNLAVSAVGGNVLNAAIEAGNGIRQAYLDGEKRLHEKRDELDVSINEKLDEINRMSRDLKINNSDLSIATYNACVVYNTRDITKLDMGVSDKVLKEKMSVYIDEYTRRNDTKTSSALDISFHVLSFFLYGTVLFLTINYGVPAVQNFFSTLISYVIDMQMGYDPEKLANVSLINNDVDSFVPNASETLKAAWEKALKNYTATNDLFNATKDTSILDKISKEFGKDRSVLGGSDILKFSNFLEYEYPSGKNGWNAFMSTYFTGDGRFTWMGLGNLIGLKNIGFWGNAKTVLTNTVQYLLGGSRHEQILNNIMVVIGALTTLSKVIPAICNVVKFLWDNLNPAVGGRFFYVLLTKATMGNIFNFNFGMDWEDIIKLVFRKKMQFGSSKKSSKKRSLKLSVKRSVKLSVKRSVKRSLKRSVKKKSPKKSNRRSKKKSSSKKRASKF